MSFKSIFVTAGAAAIAAFSIAVMVLNATPDEARLGAGGTFIAVGGTLLAMRAAEK